MINLKEVMRVILVAQIRMLSATACAIALAGCASGMSVADCSAADWTDLGFADGQSGAEAKIVEKLRKGCREHGLEVDLAAYAQGRARGLALYCTPEGGFAAGKSGREYFGVCPAEAEAAFRPDFELGAKLHSLTAAREKAIADYETAIADLDQHRYLLGVSEKRYEKPSVSNEDREQERQDMEYRRREIARIDHNLPLMLETIDAGKTALDAFKADLAAMGKPF
jgi:hypothetical protein